MRLFYLIFVAIPFLEFIVFYLVGSQIGLFPTLLMALASAIFGGAIVKLQGLRTIQAIKLSLDKGQFPDGELFEGLCLVAAGALLITPGFVTDTIGFLLLLPQTRAALYAYIKAKTKWLTGRSAAQKTEGVIEGDYETIDPLD